MFKIAQITDPHIGPEDSVYRGINVRRNFLNILDDVQGHSVDLIIISGDLALDLGEIEAYEWIKSTMDQFAIPFDILPGNHDSVERLKRIFDQRQQIQDQYYHCRNLGDFDLYYLDTESDHLSKEQMEWLRKSIQSSTCQPIVFMHHPPCLCGHQFMDRKFPLHNHGEVLEFLMSIPQINFLFCGHYHFEKELKFNDLNIFVTPSTQMQINPHNKDFEISSLDPGWRLIELEHKTVHTQTYYIPHA